LGVETGLIGVDPLAAVLLAMIRNFTEDANLFVPVGVTSGLLLIWVPPGVWIAPVAVGTSIISSASSLTS
jgi:hypothetical protein